MKEEKDLQEMDDDERLEVLELQGKVQELQEFAIWMTGCGYDFNQHEYFREQRDKLLLNTGDKEQ
jgi:hypothetical protein